MKNLLCLALFVFAISCTKEEPTSLIPLENQLSFEKKDIDAFIHSKTQKGRIFDWTDASAKMIHSAVMHSDQILAIGYQDNDGIKDEEFIGSSEKLPQSWLEKRDNIIDRVLQYERLQSGNPKLSKEDVLPFELDDEIPTLAIKSTSLKAVEDLKEDKSIRYVEPMGYEYQPTGVSATTCQFSLHQALRRLL